ncbi:MAG: CoA-binding protein [Syntrophobacteraceae bacterium]|jgi:predicted CoA-binding protein
MSIECKIEDGPAAGDRDVRNILCSSKTIAVVGISAKEESPSHKVAKYLLEHGFKVIGVNPKCDEVLGGKCYPDLKSVPGHVDVVDIFRNLDAIAGVVEEAIEIGAGTVWMQLGLEHEEAAQKARRAGLNVVMNKCMKIEHSRLSGGQTT